MVQIHDKVCWTCTPRILGKLRLIAQSQDLQPLTNINGNSEATD